MAAASTAAARGGAGTPRRALCTAKPGAALDGQLSENWFEASSERIAGLWQVEVGLAQALRQACEAQIQASEQELQDSEGLLRQLRDNPPPHTHAVACFFEEAAQVEAVPVLPGVADGPASAVPGGADQPTVAALKTLLQAQSSRLARVEVELDTARRALHERKVIERAKRALMSRLGMSEEDAFRALQKASMDHNRRLVDVAEATLAMPELAAPAAGAPGRRTGVERAGVRLPCPAPYVCGGGTPAPCGAMGRAAPDLRVGHGTCVRAGHQANDGGEVAPRGEARHRESCGAGDRNTWITASRPRIGCGRCVDADAFFVLPLRGNSDGLPSP